MTQTDNTSEVSTPHGPALVHVHRSDRPRAALVLGHGAGGGVGAPDLTAARDVGLEQGVTVVLVEQPYRVAGRRAPAPAKQLDAAWRAVIDALRADELNGLMLIVGGRSMGARVACRTAASSGAIAVLCLAFPLQPPRRSGPRPTRIDELDLLTVPTLVVQGERDPVRDAAGGGPADGGPGSWGPQPAQGHERGQGSDPRLARPAPRCLTAGCRSALSLGLSSAARARAARRARGVPQERSIAPIPRPPSG